jgi:cell shape-determining protein MreC
MVANGIYSSPEQPPIDASTAVEQVVTVVKQDGTHVFYDLVAFADQIIEAGIRLDALTARDIERARELSHLQERVTLLERRNTHLREILMDAAGAVDPEDDPDI